MGIVKLHAPHRRRKSLKQPAARGQQEDASTGDLLGHGKIQSNSGGLESPPTAPLTRLNSSSETNGRPKLEILHLTQVQVLDSPTASIPDDETIVVENASSKSWGQLVVLFKCRIRFAKARTGGRLLDDPGEGHIYRNTITLLSKSMIHNDQGITKLSGIESEIRGMDPLKSLIEAPTTRLRLLELANMLNIYKPSLVNALRADDEEIHNVLVVVLLTPELTGRALELRGLEAETLLDLLQSMLDKGFLFNILETETIRKTYNLIYRLSKACGIFPSSLMVEDVVNVETSAKRGGGYADVFRGSYQGKQVALKCLRIFLKGHDRHEAHKAVCREALLWKRVRHKYVLPFLGIDGTSRSPSICLLSPWMTNGTIRDFMKENKDSHLKQHISEIAEGLEHLHGHNIIHGDLRGANILVDAEWHVQIADFGLAVLAETAFSDESSPATGAVRWMAPELFEPFQDSEEESGRTKATDVYSFACTCVELSTGRDPFHQNKNSEHVRSLSKAARIDLLSSAMRKYGSKRVVSSGIISVMQQCWGNDPTGRPTMAQVVGMLQVAT
ncbi:Protein kinase domain-containing protein [Pleurotus pulmonarius]